jgi:hypothetical protein
MKVKKTTYMFIYDPDYDLIRTFTVGARKRKKFTSIRLAEEDYFLDLFGTSNIKFSGLCSSNYEVPDTFVKSFGYNHVYGVM